MKKKRFAIAILILALVLLVGCSSGKTPKKEKAIVADIVADDSYFAEYGLKVVESEMGERYTSTEWHEDEVEMWIRAECDLFIYERRYTVCYTLYDNGWVLDDVDGYGTTFTPKTDVSQADVDAYAEELFGEVTFVSRENESPSQVAFYYQTKTREGYIDVYRDVMLTYKYTPREGWVYYTPEYGTTWQTITGVEWDITGEWLYDDGTDCIWINIISVDEAAKTVVMEYNIKYSKFGVFKDQTREYTSNGAVTLPYRWYQFGNYNIDDSYDMYMEIPDTDKDVWIDNCDGIRFEGHVLTLQ